jgi:hypothetical protein
MSGSPTLSGDNLYFTSDEIFRMTLQGVGDTLGNNNYLWPSNFGFYRFWFFSHGKTSAFYDQTSYYDFELETTPDDPVYD